MACPDCWQISTAATGQELKARVTKKLHQLPSESLKRFIPLPLSKARFDGARFTCSRIIGRDSLQRQTESRFVISFDFKKWVPSIPRLLQFLRNYPIKQPQRMIRLPRRDDRDPSGRGRASMSPDRGWENSRPLSLLRMRKYLPPASSFQPYPLLLCHGRPVTAAQSRRAVS
ncbi:hypothetical protein PABG_12045 [Paracoccidioides brasiliensis Pb03]|nr:hypothetical protein PABG_12045 [Paracoccidioides brasiliensis Pb03]